MNTFTACVERGENWWVAQLVEDPGVIVQARRLDQIQEEIRDALALSRSLSIHRKQLVFILTLLVR